MSAPQTSQVHQAPAADLPPTNRRYHALVDAMAAAKAATTAYGREWIACDDEGGESPRYSIAEKPRVGDKVSKSLDGEAHPDGTVISVSPTLMVTTDTGSRYHRWRDSSRWRQRSWDMLRGHRNADG